MNDKFNQIETRNVIQILQDITNVLVQETLTMSNCSQSKNFYMHIDRNIINGSIFLCTQSQQQQLLNEMSTNSILCPMINTMQRRLGLTLNINNTKLAISTMYIYEPIISTTEKTIIIIDNLINMTRDGDIIPILSEAGDINYYGQHGSDMRFVLLTIIGTLAITATIVGCAIFCLQAFKRNKKQENEREMVPQDEYDNNNNNKTMKHGKAITAASIELHKFQHTSDSVNSESRDDDFDGIDVGIDSSDKKVTVIMATSSTTSTRGRNPFDQQKTNPFDLYGHTNEDSLDGDEDDEDYDDFPEETEDDNHTGHNHHHHHHHHHGDHDHNSSWNGSCKCSCHLAMTETTTNQSDQLLQDITCDPEYYDTAETYGATLGLIGIPHPPNVLDGTFNKVIMETTVSVGGSARQCCKLQEALSKDQQNGTIQQRHRATNDSKPSSFEMPRYAVV